MQFNISDIIKILPHSYPFLLVDRVIECDPGKSIKAIKNVTFNEPFFIGHFPGHPIMPGVLIIESLAQASAICVLGKETIENKVVYLRSIENAKFRKLVTPGDTLILQANIQSVCLGVHKFRCIASVSEEKVAEATISAVLQNK
ncbi:MULTISPECIES: 3-hydroxyacyl-ACP dehydratase FabZ [Wolbachia]|uniref:3-hydroxyacyl-[acyl-carrier-protein] dehydratase FabZ n=1 Tax=Wolbachia pipientis TaxID=955 RepID=A0A6H2NUS6_WOLPI|nr:MULTISPECIES: 3-hydroxyacyl-ACP dehydratase FabZ [Wolbachia]MBA8756337.1 3-hydroxyacyl-ACP dehydratase FabZ [Wolbachia pipientis]MBS9530764.1 3-hydroxyacyl-ACP dehydratase FabZ [Wolbachia endosymbiont of Rhagoletis cerasi]MDE5057580.1 3-hydroxyacyl-ACP dehydratase FabZ [Wolbachia endosymbiont of Drosophila bocki]MDE5067382.1 3-hydroxyacyl-ACP dehydratase FabZ [Wolbachia endosymbiont of Drosophila leontia]TVS92534.1 3-hydroxyacyl-ACP dehydratase FabZ [Wolbachia pipientis]